MDQPRLVMLALMGLLAASTSSPAGEIQETGTRSEGTLLASSGCAEHGCSSGDNPERPRPQPKQVYQPLPTVEPEEPENEEQHDVVSYQFPYKNDVKDPEAYSTIETNGVNDNRSQQYYRREAQPTSYQKQIPPPPELNTLYEPSQADTYNTNRNYSSVQEQYSNPYVNDFSPRNYPRETYPQPSDYNYANIPSMIPPLELMSEADFIGRLRNDTATKKMYWALDREGREMAVYLASQSTYDPREAVREATRLMNERKQSTYMLPSYSR